MLQSLIKGAEVIKKEINNLVFEGNKLKILKNLIIFRKDFNNLVSIKQGLADPCFIEFFVTWRSTKI